MGNTNQIGHDLAAHAVEELCQLGYTVQDGKLMPPDNLHELARVAGWALAAAPLTDARIAELAHRMAYRYQQMDPAHKRTTFLFTLHTLIPFVRECLRSPAPQES